MPIPVLMPALSPTMKEGTLAKWLKKEGDVVKPGQVLAEIETDKAIMEVEAVEGGVMGKILVPEGQAGVQINALIAVILEEGEDTSSIDAVVQKYCGETEPTQLKSHQSESVAVGNIPTTEKEITIPQTKTTIFITPLAKRIASQNQLDISKITGSGPHGRIVKADVISYIESLTSIKEEGAIFTSAASTNKAEYSKLPLSSMRRVIAKRLLEAKQTVPHFYLSINCEVDKLLALREEINLAAPCIDNTYKYKISVNDCIIKAVAKGMLEIPQINRAFTEDAILQYHNIDIAVAVAVDDGLITPIIRNAEQKDIVHVSNEMKELIKRAKDSKLKPEEFQGGRFSISNLGMYDIESFTAIINPPQSCILAVGASVDNAIVKNGQIVAARTMNLTLSCDHRVIDGATAATFLKALRHFIANPVSILL